MRLIDELFVRTPFYGSRRMRVRRGGKGSPVNRKRVSRLMRRMGFEAIYPMKRLRLPIMDPENWKKVADAYDFLIGGTLVDMVMISV